MAKGRVSAIPLLPIQLNSIQLHRMTEEVFHPQPSNILDLHNFRFEETESLLKSLYGPVWRMVSKRVPSFTVRVQGGNEISFIKSLNRTLMSTALNWRVEIGGKPYLKYEILIRCSGLFFNKLRILIAMGLNLYSPKWKDGRVV